MKKLLCLLVIAMSSHAYAADVAVSALPAATTPSGTEVVPCVQTTTKKCTINQIRGVGTATQAWDADLDTLATKTIPSGALVGTTDAQTLSNKSITGSQITSAVPTATALAANGTNCSAGQAPLGVDASGAVEGCFTPAGSGTVNSGTQYGLAYYPASATAVSYLGALGTSAQVLHGNASGAPSFSAVSLSTDVTGTLSFGNGGTGLATAADDTVLLSTGSAWAAAAIPNCVDSGGNHLNYTTATNAFSCGTSSSGGGGAPTTATYITQTADATLSAEQALSALATGIVKNTTTTGVLSIAAAGTDYALPTSVQSITTTSTISVSNRVVLCSATGGAVTVNLAAVASLQNITVVNTGTANDCTIDPNSTEQVNGATTLIVPINSSRSLANDGTAWFVY